MTINSFTGDYRWLSNFWYCQVQWNYDIYPSTEHAYQAAKFADPKTREQIRNAPTFKEAKRLGYSKGLTPGWDNIKLIVMENLLRQKFRSGSDLAEKLVATYPHKLVEGNTWGDTYWGVCQDHGENQLGKLLMKIRQELL